MISAYELSEIRRRVNPQYQDQRGTESYERKQLLDEIDRLRHRVERLRGLCKSASGWLLDAGDTVNSEIVLDLIGDAEELARLDGIIEGAGG